MSLLLLAALSLQQTLKPDTSPLVHEAVVEAPVEQVWAAFTTKEGLESWMVAHAEVDLRIGGKWRTHYRKEGVLGDEGTIEHDYLSYDPGRMISFHTVKVPKGFPFKEAITRMWSVVYFEPAGAGRTKVALRCLGFTQDEDSQKMRAFFERGNKFTMNELVAKFRKK